MGRQTFRDESNYKHEPHTKHYVDDEFKKGTSTRNWKKNVNAEEEILDAPEDEPVINRKPTK